MDINWKSVGTLVMQVMTASSTSFKTGKIINKDKTFGWENSVKEI